VFKLIVRNQFETYYGLSDTVVSLIFLISPLGYFIAAYLTGFIHLRLGQRGIAAIGPAFQLLFAVGLSAHPPYWMVLALFLVEAIGTGLLDGSWCAWAGAMTNGNTIQVLIHRLISYPPSLLLQWILCACEVACTQGKETQSHTSRQC
jgi:fucose permease